MPKHSTASLTFYPAYCFSLSPTYNTWARLSAADVQALDEQPGYEGQNVYFHLNHPIKWVRLAGLVIAFDLVPPWFILTIDDSSGANIEVKYKRPTPVLPDAVNAAGGSIATDYQDRPVDTDGTTTTGRKISLPGVDVGKVVKIKGGISAYKGQKQITLEKIEIIRGTADEVRIWTENTEFHQDVLDHPWVVSEAEEQKARRDMEDSERRRKRRQEKEQRKQLSKAEREMRKREKEKARQVKEEQSRKRREEEERKRREREEKEIREKRRREINERREQALRELGAGR